MATSTTLSFGLAFEPAERGIMRRNPRDPSKHVLDGHAIWRIAFVGTLIACSAFAPKPTWNRAATALNSSVPC